MKNANNIINLGKIAILPFSIIFLKIVYDMSVK